jgi:hypothetical protein
MCDIEGRRMPFVVFSANTWQFEAFLLGAGIWSIPLGHKHIGAHHALRWAQRV